MTHFDYNIYDNTNNNFELNKLVLFNNTNSLKSNVIKNYIDDVNKNNINLEDSKLYNNNDDYNNDIEQLHNKMLYLNSKKIISSQLSIGSAVK